MSEQEQTYVDKARLTTSIWRYGRPQGRKLADGVRFLPDGRVVGGLSNHKKWLLENNRLIIKNGDGNTVAQLANTEQDRFEGRVKGNLRYYKRVTTEIDSAILTENIWLYGRPRRQGALKTGIIFNVDGSITNGLWNQKSWRIFGKTLQILDGSDDVAATLTKTSDSRFEGRASGRPRIFKIANVSYRNHINNVISTLENDIQVRQHQIRSLNHQMTKLTNGKIKIVFLINKYGSTTATTRLIRYLQSDERFDARVYIVDLTRADARGVRQKIAAELESQKISYQNISNTEASLEMSDFLPHYILRQDPWDADWDGRFGTKSISYAYLLMVYYTVIDDFIAGDYLLDYANNAYFQESSYIFNSLTENNRAYLTRIGQEKLIEKYHAIGNLKAIEIYETKGYWPEKLQDYGKKILIVAHHAITSSWLNFGLLADMAQTYYDLAKNHPNFSFVFNPHPLMRERAARLLSDFEKRWAELPNTAIVDDIGMYALIKASDLVIAEGVSVLYEAQILRKPIIWLEKANHMPLSEDGEALMSGVHRLKDYSFEAIDKQLTTIIENGDELAPQQSRNVAPWLSEPHPEEKIADCLYEGIFGENTAPSSEK
ncbi:hypothetical protein [Pseudolactococcus insecticola]|uniref:Uncharacterized protein n=1 Tax=Pseudolactococcus insecticola TaxID=2709158 RepID=A0A6A0B6K2_9LACT|nr:hypothetical protein [Lactococcus insecticola]GFH40303.1 hypothetical protein Hs20B_07010 [Lactococcus insecticola]